MDTPSKPHFVFLDGLRGLAALWVAAYHLSQMFRTPLKPEHAYLAVDFFFCLSGFVVAAAYDGRMDGGMGVVEFFRRRLIRLYPMIAFGVVLGAGVVAGEWLAYGTGDLKTWLKLSAAFGVSLDDLVRPVWDDGSSPEHEYTAELRRARG